MRRLLIIVTMAAAGFGAYKHLMPPDRLSVLMGVPTYAPETSEAGIRDITGTGEQLMAEPGRHTIIELYNSGCTGCIKLSSHLRQFVELRPDVAVRKIQVDRNLARQFNVQTVPHVIIYDWEGNLVAGDDGKEKEGLNMLYEWMNEELRRHELFENTEVVEK